MNSIGDLIVTSRKAQNLTQEQLSELSKVNLRTIQRIEKNVNKPRENTLRYICDVLDIDVPSLNSEFKKAKPNFTEIIFQYFFLAILNLALMAIIGWTTLASSANFNSRTAGLILSFFIPIFIVSQTLEMNKNERLLKFGFGFIVYILFSISYVGIPTAFISGLLPCLFICLLTLFYGEMLYNKYHK